MVSYSVPNFSTSQMVGEHSLGHDSPRQLANVLEASPQPAGQWNSSPLPRPRQLPAYYLRPRKGCLRVPRNFQIPAQTNTPNNKHINFAFPPRCLVTGATYEEHPQDGEAWRQQQADKIQHEATTRQALSGTQEYRGDVMKDPWADQGWEPLGLGEDTPMEGVSAEMDAEAAQWMQYEARLEEQHAVAESHRFAVQDEVRRFHGAELSMGTRPLVRLRLEHMGMLRSEPMVS